MTRQADPAQLRSRRALLVIGAIALIALASPWLWRSWHEAHLTDGKERAFAKSSAHDSVNLAMCLLKRRPGGLTLEISSQNHFIDETRGVVVELSANADHRREVSAWVPKGSTLEAGETAHLDSCLN
ncbi:MAG: hypothetical protein ACKOOL_09905 [Novosphingobium sp.]